MLITTLLKSLYESLIREMVVMYVETDDINEAFIIFETLNARGKELETSDLLKNHVFRIGGPKINKYKINGIL
ncbi:GmrSD restriction endonuclease domain-containing protein [Macrococcoides caseolyticum]|uniref:GmrSD restriction endonuclease domain-containing protein n=1 Tax=Macrococcoides caseolyticum TaxID=69966 RepID=UPI001E360DDA